jgi:nucleoside-diphosphate-sugar epimerase
MILITGTTGFIGKNLLSEVLSKGLDVRATVRKPSPELGRQVPICAVGDIGSDTDWRIALENVQTVVHTAARAHMLNDQSADPLAVFREVNTTGTLVLARQAAEMNVKRFVFLSSIGVNGVEKTSPSGSRICLIRQSHMQSPS